MKIKELSYFNGINQIELAKKLNISQKTISNYLNGVTEPPASILCKLADYFDVSLDYLCDRHWQNKVGYIPEDKKELVKQIIALDENDTREIKAFLNGLKAGKTQNQNFKVFN